MQCPSSPPIPPSKSEYSRTPLCTAARREGGIARKEEKLEGQREREREESIALPSARPQTSTVVDLAEHFNDSSLPRAFTVPAVARLGQQSVHARSMKQLLNNWASRCAPFCLFFTPLLISHTIVIYVSSSPSPLLPTRSFTVSLLHFVLPSRFSIRKKKKGKKNEYRATLVLEPSSAFHSFFPHLDLPLTIANENRRFSSLKNLGEFQVFFFVFLRFFFKAPNREPLCHSSTSDFKKLLITRKGVEAKLVILYQGKKRFLICHCENDEVAALFKWVKFYWFEREGNIC